MSVEITIPCSGESLPKTFSVNGSYDAGELPATDVWQFKVQVALLTDQGFILAFKTTDNLVPAAQFENHWTVQMKAPEDNVTHSGCRIFAELFFRVSQDNGTTFTPYTSKVETDSIENIEVTAAGFEIV